MKETAKDKFYRRQRRNRYRLKQRSGGERLRLSVFRSGKNICAQIIDDKQGKTLVAASTLEKDIKAKLKSTSNREAAALVGKTVAERAVAKGITSVYLDRGGYAYHGKVVSFADSARESGLVF